MHPICPVTEIHPFYQFSLILLLMPKVGKKILLLLAVVTVIAHGILPHIHLDDIVAMVDHHHHHQTSTEGGNHQHDAGGPQSDHHNLFSFAQLDEDFIPSKYYYKKFELRTQYLSPVALTSLLDTFPGYTKKVFGRYKEYPPPGNYFYELPSRAPPAVYLS